MAEPNLLNYQAKSEAARSVEDLIGKIDSAHHQWDTYGAALSLSYKEAYKAHTDTLKAVEQRFKSESSSLFYYILVAFVAGAAGGVAGMLITPILNRAGNYIGRRLAAQTNSKLASMTIAYREPAIPAHVRTRALEAVEKQQRFQGRVNKATEIGQTTILEGTKEVGVKGVEKLELEKFLAPAPPKPSDGDAVFQPPETDPHKFDLLKRIEIGICASVLKENVRRYQFLTDEGRFPAKSAAQFRESLIQGSFLNQQPGTSQIEWARSEKARKQAELAMWIAWAQVMNIDYWKIRLKGIQHIDRGIDYNDFREVKRYDPVFDRLMYCGVGPMVGMSYTVARDWGHMTQGLNGQVLNIPALKQLGNRQPVRWLARVDNIVRQRKFGLNDFENITGEKF